LLLPGVRIHSPISCSLAFTSKVNNIENIKKYSSISSNEEFHRRVISSRVSVSINK
jgi:hypothetical protein